jgi:hypothetical protein
VSRKYCLLPQGYSEACQLDCKRNHRHLSQREVERLKDKEIKFLDFHPITKLPRFIELFEEQRSDFVDPGIVQGTQKTHVTEAIMRNAAGAFRIKARKSHWADAGTMETAARNKVAAYGAEGRELSRIIAHDRNVELRNFAWTDEGIVASFKEDRFEKNSIVEDIAWLPEGNSLRVGLKPRTPGALDAALGYWRFINMSLSSIGSERRTEMQEHPKRGPFRSEEPTQWTMRVMAKSVLREQAAALKRLDVAWREIVAHFCAGPFSDVMNSLPASELPSQIVRETLRAYLEIPSERWSAIGVGGTKNERHSTS